MNSPSQLASTLRPIKHFVAWFAIIVFLMWWADNFLGRSRPPYRPPQPSDSQIWRSANLTLSSIEQYEELFGVLPVMDEKGSPWWRILQDSESESHFFIVMGFPGTYLEDEPILDQFRNPLIYIPPDSIRCTGPNGVDDGGDLDDWTFSKAKSYTDWSTKEPDWSLWYPDHFAHARVRAAVFVLLSVLVAPVIGRLCWRRARVFGIASACLIPSILVLQIRPPDVHIMGWPKWLEFLEGVARCVAFFAAITASYALLMFVLEYPIKRIVAAFARRDGLCEVCNYDLSGLESNRCPECGRLFDQGDGMTEMPVAEQSS